MDDSIIISLGRWKSLAYFEYVRILAIYYTMLCKHLCIMFQLRYINLSLWVLVARVLWLGRGRGGRASRFMQGNSMPPQTNRDKYHSKLIRGGVSSPHILVNTQ